MALEERNLTLFVSREEEAITLFCEFSRNKIQLEGGRYKLSKCAYRPLGLLVQECARDLFVELKLKSIFCESVQQGHIQL
jgi:hypothetical protein